MALTKCTVATDVIGTIGTNVAERGLTTQQFKDKFDEMPEGIKTYINDTLTVEQDAKNTTYEAHMADVVTDADGAHGLIMKVDTWTPTIIGSTTPGTQTYSVQSGTYVRIGNLVHIICRVTLASTSGAAGNILVGGLPFPRKSTPSGRNSVHLSAVSGVTGQSLSTIIGSYIAASNSNILISADGIAVSNLTASTSFDLDAIYEI